MLLLCLYVGENGLLLFTYIDTGVAHGLTISLAMVLGNKKGKRIGGGEPHVIEELIIIYRMSVFLGWAI